MVQYSAAVCQPCCGQDLAMRLIPSGPSGGLAKRTQHLRNHSTKPTAASRAQCIGRPW